MSKTNQTGIISEDEILIRRDVVMEMLGGISIPSLYRWIKDGRIPKPIKLSRGVAVWKKKWITDFIDGLEADQKL